MYKPVHMRERFTCTVLEPEKPKNNERLPSDIQEEIDHISVPKAKKTSKYLPGERLLRRLHKEQQKQRDADAHANHIINNSIDTIIFALGREPTPS